MKVVALFLFGLALAAANPSWEEFKGKFGRKYVDLEEERYRLNVFLDNLQYIEEFNKKYERGEVTYNLAINQFSDLTNEEFNAVMKGYKKGPRPAASFTSTDAAPESTEVDWRTKGAVTPVKDQGQCGSCWAFSTTGGIEGQHFLKTGRLVSLSEQQLVDCAGGSYYNQGCNGGWVERAIMYVRDNGGIDTESSYPYEARDNTCRFNSNSIGATCTGYVGIAQGSESALKTATRDIGPISVAIDASHRSFQSYYTGVYYEPSCSSSQLDHAVLVVGYGSEGGQDFWLVKNSWATSWGESGYIKMARNRSNNCGIATDACYPTV